jgi:hypothetical protein
MAKNVFQSYVDEVYPYTFRGRIEVERLMGGTPSDPKVAEGWLRSKMGLDKDLELKAAVEEVMIERGVSSDDAIEIINTRRHLNGFKKDADGLYIEGRHLKAALKEAASVARAVDYLPSRMGATKKGTLSFVAEHIIVVEERLYLGREECDEIIQSFPRNPITRQTGIQYTEQCSQVEIHFTIATDYHFTEREWATIWLTGGQQGIGASRSQGYGRYKVTEWTPLTSKKATAKQLDPQD